MVDAASTAGNAAVQLLAQHWPGKSKRRDSHMALIGGLLRDGLHPDQVKAFVEALAEATADEEVSRRVALVAPTAQKLKDDKPATGWPALAKLLGTEGPPVVRQLRRLLGLTACLADLAAHKQLPIDFLEGLGLYDLPLGGVAIPYKDGSGKLAETKSRLGLSAASSKWPGGKPLLPYGEDRLADAAPARHLTLVEGESDCWTLWFYGQPALGLPGSGTAHKTLTIAHIAAVPKLYIFGGDSVGLPLAGGPLCLCPLESL
jgi:hypothetical protein